MDTTFGDLLILEDKEKGRVKDNLPDFEPVLYPIFENITLSTIPQIEISLTKIENMQSACLGMTSMH